MRRTSGVTLIELLIAISLVSLLSLGILVALRIGVTSMERSNSRLMANRKVASVDRILHAQIAGFIPVRSGCRADSQAPLTPVLYFQGAPQTMRLVSSYSLQEAARGYPRVLEYQVIPGERGEGVRLVVNEIVYTGPQTAIPVCTGFVQDPETGAQLPHFPPVQIGSHSFVLADRIAYCRFSYQRKLPDGRDIWLPRWVRPEIPSAIRIELAPLEPSPARLQLMALTIPVRPDRIWNAPYHD